MSHQGSTQNPVAAKPARQRLAHVVLRPDTVAAFRDATGRRLTVVCAPAGYGKTTVTAALVKRLRVPAVWHTLDVLDRDPAVCLRSLVDALRARVPTFGEAILERLHNDPDPNVDRLLVLFVHEVEHRVRKNLHLVLDDYQEASGCAELDRLLDYLLAKAPRQLRFVVLTRCEPGFSTAKMRLEGQVGALSVDDLRLSKDQAHDVLAAQLKKPLSAGSIDRLVEVTEGWPASIVLAARAMEWLDVGSVEAALADPRLRDDLYSYLAEQVYQREDTATRAFLQRTCCLERMTAELADRVADTDDAHRVLEHLAANRSFTFVVEERGTYRYHTLFRDYLRQLCLKELGAQRFRHLQRETARALEESGQIEMAVELLFKADEPRAALDTIARGGEAGLDGLHSEPLARWLARLRASGRATDPWARLMACQLHRRTGDFDAALAEVRQAADAFSAANDTWGSYNALSMTECVLFWKGDMADARLVCDEALALAKTSEQRMHTLLSIGSSSLAVCDLDTADAAIAGAVELSTDASKAERVRAQMLKAYAAYLRGDLRVAQSEKPSTAVAGVPPATRIGALYVRGLIALELGDYHLALEMFEAARTEALQCGHDLDASQAAGDIGLVMCSQGHTEEGLDLIRSVAESDESTFDPTQLAINWRDLSTVLRHTGDLEAALLAAKRSVQLSSPDRDPFVSLMCSANLHYLRCILHDAPATDLLAVTTSADALNLGLVSARSQLLTAIVALLRGNERSCRLEFAQRIPVQLERGYLHMLAQELCAQPLAAFAALDALRATPSQSLLLKALATHWRFDTVFCELLRRDGDLAVRAVRTAAETASDDILRSVLSEARQAHSDALDEMADAMVAQRFPGASRLTTCSTGLTNREQQVLALMASGKCNDEIAKEFFVSPSTVKTHINHIFSKLGVTTRVQAVLKHRELSEDCTAESK